MLLIRGYCNLVLMKIFYRAMIYHSIYFVYRIAYRLWLIFYHLYNFHFRLVIGYRCDGIGYGVIYDFLGNF